MKRFLCVLLSLLLLTSCGRTAANPSNQPDGALFGSPELTEATSSSGSNANVDGNDASGASTLLAPPPEGELDVATLADDPDVRFDADMVPVEKGYSDTIGSFSFTTDSENAWASIDVSPDSEDLLLELTDDAGRKWSLHLPSGCVREETSIVISQVSDIKGETALGVPVAGLYLYPSGLLFVKPATLSVEGDGEMALMTADAMGRNVMPGIPQGNEMAEGRAAIRIDHFSSAALFTPDSLKNAGEKLNNKLAWACEEMYKLALARTKNLLKEEMRIPVPPAMPQGCDTDESDNAQQDAYETFEKAFLEPENSILSELVTSRTAYEKLTGKKSRYIDEETERQLMRRMTRKVNKLIKTYMPKEEYLTPVSRVSVHVWRQVTLLNYEWSELEYFSSWARQAALQHIEKIRTEHAYDSLYVVVKNLREALLLADDTDAAMEKQRAVLSKLERAMRFRVHYEYQMTSETHDVRTESDVNIQMNWEELFAQLGFIHGKGMGKFTKYTDTDILTVSPVHEQYPVDALLGRFHPCAGTTDVIISNLTPYVEEFKYENSKDITRYDPGMMRMINTIYFHTRVMPLAEINPEGVSYFNFEEKIQNGSALMVDGVHEGESNDLKVKVKIQVFHEP